MGFIKKQSAGFYFMVLTVIAALAGMVFYMINCNTDYFRNLGMNTIIIVLLTAAIVLEIVYIVGYTKMGVNPVMDMIPLVNGVLLMVAFALFASARVNSVATILSFERNAQTMADLSSAIVGMVCCLTAVILNIAGSFFKVVKDEE
ncbi:hypothetical protein [Mediterraneibacter agrestimuris]|uniref:hypothetical protein n=1 Tax=Mediterraneibacter agrestimuris TaxID=2941333 RepID=UPI00203E5887|nr:hypothetical protein [Mediterraneibacter agrestimuris]